MSILFYKSIRQSRHRDHAKQSNANHQPLKPVQEQRISSALQQYWGDNPDIHLEPLASLVDLADNRKLTPTRTSGPNNIHLDEYIKRKQAQRHPFDFASCRMSNCFDFSRCSSSGPVKIHILPPTLPTQSYNFLNISGESNIIHRNILNIIKESKHYEPEPERACLFMLSDDTLDRDPLSKSFRPGISNLASAEFNYGMNFIVFNLYSGTWPDYREDDFAGFNIGAAILAKASNSISYHRPKFDVSIPLFSYMHPTYKEEFPRSPSTTETRNRTYFLTFKGKRYVIGGGSNTRNSLYHLNNHDDVIMLTTCRHGKKWREASDARCSEDDITYDQFDFDDLMRNSDFCLTPRGRRLGSFRFLESLSYDCIPVVLSDGWVWPFDELIDWSEVSIQFIEDLIFHVPDMLRDIESHVVDQMHKNCRTYYQKYFSTTKKIVMTTLSVIEKRIKNQMSLKGD